jgi:hypothetical protein
MALTRILGSFKDAILAGGTESTFSGSAASTGSFGRVEATRLSGDGASLTGIAGRKNIIINGAMKVAQRGASFAAAVTGTFPADRFQFYHSSIGAYTITQDSSAPDGFANSIKIDCTTADASPGAADHLYLATKIEAQDLQHLKKGTASAESVTLSFWVKSNKTANGQVNLRDMDNIRIIANTYTISVADTWEQKTITFAGDTTGAFNDDNGVGLNIDFWFDSGSDFSSGAMPTSWESTATADQNAGGTLALADSTSNYINITGVQLEVGSTATDFEHRSYGEELEKCKRYYQQSWVGNTPNVNTDYVSITPPGSLTANIFIWDCPYQKEVRAAPTITLYNPSDGTAGELRCDANDTSYSISVDNAWVKHSRLTGTSLSAGRSKFHYKIESEL